jgi:AcrR family transcriptional regulator
MPMATQDNGSAKQRILDVAAEMFSQKGFAATRVEKIALQADVPKALIYYYFPSKEAILDYLIESFFTGLSNSGISFMQSTIQSFQQEGRMTIMADRFDFATEDDLMAYMGETKRYIETLLDWLLSQRQILRIILSESLSDRKHEWVLLRYFTVLDEVANNPSLGLRLTETKNSHKGGVVFSKFFFSMLPMITFAVYSENFAAMSEQDVETLKSFFLESILSRSNINIEGKSLLFQPRSNL